MSIKNPRKFVDEATKKLWAKYVQTNRVMYYIYEHQEKAQEVIDILYYIESLF